MPVQSEIRLAQFIISLKISLYLPSLSLPVGGYSRPCLVDVVLRTARAAEGCARVCVSVCVRVYQCVRMCVRA